MSIRNARNVSGSGKEIYGEMCKEIIDRKKLVDIITPAEKLSFKLNLFDVIKTAIYSNDKQTQKLGWALYHDLTSKAQKAFKAEIRAEEKAKKAK